MSSGGSLSIRWYVVVVSRGVAALYLLIKLRRKSLVCGSVE